MLGLADWPPLDHGGDPEVAEERRETVAGGDRDDTDRRRATVAGAALAGPVPSTCVASAFVNAAARVSRTSRAWLSRFSTLIRLSCPTRQPVADDLVRPLVVDVDLECPGVARDEDRLAHRFERLADRVDVEDPGTGRLEQEHRLVAEALVGVRHERRGLGAGPGVRAVAAALAALAGLRPTMCSSAPWNSRYSPCPPESTTPASRRIASRVGVRATECSAAVTVAPSTLSISGSRSAAATAAAADSRMTVRIVPSTGLATAPYAVCAPSDRAWARSRPLNRSCRQDPRPCRGRSGW